MTLNIDAKRLSISSGIDKAFISSNPWSYDREFGIVHPCGCAICRNYMLHVSTEADAESYAQAVLERDAELRNRFFEGFRRGRKAQLEHDTERLKTYRSERNVAREQVSVYEIKIDEAEKEILRLKDELLALRMAYNELKYEGPEVSLVNHRGESSEDGCDHDYSISDIDDGDEYKVYGGLSDGISEGEVTAVENDTVEDDGVQKPPFGQTLAESPDLSPPSLVEEVPDVERETTTQSPLQSAHRSISPPPCPSSPSPGPPSPSSVDEIRRKMKLAHLPNHGDILAYVKGLISEAHKTHHSQRTEVQRILMSEWRRPPPTITAYAPATPFIQSITVFTPATPPSIAQAPAEPEEIDVYVDASGSGIGFYLLGRWQAWKLKEGWRSVKCRDIQWAEAVAVEMGVRLLLKAGYTETKIRLHSDNRQVVDAISTKDINRTEVGPIVQLYDNLCCSYKLDCSIQWIPGAENPADAPSRFLLLDKNKRFPCDVTIPPHLQEFVLPYCLSE